MNCWTEEPGIEVKAAETVRAEDFRGLRRSSDIRPMDHRVMTGNPAITGG